MPDWREVTNDTKLRVAFYGRVSTEHEMQVSALKNQIQWYEELAERNPNWEIIGSVTSYLDRGITGTQAQKRPNFLRLIEDAMTGKIDMIVTREVSRFARNTVETLNYVRELKEKGVEVYFVNDNIHSIRDNDGELRLTLMASLAQEESRKISERAKAGQYISRKNGVLYGTSRILGYTRVRSVHDKDKAGRIGDKSVPTFVIDEDEADTVRRIFQLYREGCGLKEIKITLSKEGRKNSSGEVSWFESTISRVLSNPMYIGKQEQCKTEIVDYLTGKAKQLPKEERVLVDGDFEPIIDEEVFREVQAIKNAKAALVPKRNTASGAGRTAAEKWTQKLLCSCGSRFRRYKWRTNQKRAADAYGYACSNRAVNGTAAFRKNNKLPPENGCDMRSIPAWQLELMGLKVFNGLWSEHFDAVLDTFDKMTPQDERIAVSTKSDAERYQTDIEKLEKKIDRLIDLYTDEKIDQAHYESKYAALCGELAEKRELLSQCTSPIAGSTSRDELSEALARMKSMVDLSGSKLDAQTVRWFVDKVLVRSDHCFEWLVNVTGDAPVAEPVLFPVRGSSPATTTAIVTYADAAKNAQEVRDRYYTRAFTFYIPFETAQAFRSRDNTFLRRGQWTDLLVEVYVRTKKL